MRLKYQTGIASMAQFIVVALLGIPDTLISIISACHGHGDQCSSNFITSVIFYILTAFWFAFLWMLGYAAQDRRSRGLAFLLIGAEGLTALIALFNSRHDSNLLTMTTSVLDFVLAVWVVILAIRLIKAKGGRIVTSTRKRNRQRRNPTTTSLR